MQMFKIESRRSLWFYSFVFISIFLCFVTVFNKELNSLIPGVFGAFNLRGESNFASLFSGVFLLVIALHAFDGWALNQSCEPRVANAWMMLSLVLVALSFDEIGSLHERVPSIGGLSVWWSLLPFALVLGGMAGYAILCLYRTPELRKKAIVIFFGFVLFASVALQEHLEWTVDWTASSNLHFFKVRLRPVIEEGTELLGMALLLFATLGNTRGILSRVEVSRFPVLEGVVSWRNWIVVPCLIGMPLIAYATLIVTADGYPNGQPADWPAVALFVLAGFAAARPFFIAGHGVGWLGWGLVLIAGLGCASTIIPVGSWIALAMFAILFAAAVIIWTLDSRYAKGSYLPVGLILSVGLIGALLASQNDVVTYTLVQYTALALYWVNSSVEQQESSATVS
ncbi:MAG: hypothetical protein ACR2RD_08560 [Woeseiaceae bacterium]